MPPTPAPSNAEGSSKPGVLKTKVIFNPAANKGRCGKTWPAIKQRLEAVLGPVDASVTTARGAGSTLARAAFANGCRRFVSVGGDGTLNEIVNGLVADDRLIDPEIVVAQIPAGTSNAVARAMGHAGLGPSADAAYAALAGTATRPIDLFRADSVGADGASQTRYGFLLATLGAPATVGLRAAAVPLLKRLGPLAYVITAVATALTYRPREVSIRIDGGTIRRELMWGAMICSSAGAGEGLLLAPGAIIDDGKIDLIAMGALTRREALLEIIPKLADGSYSRHVKVTRDLLEDVHIQTREPTPVDVDGEPVGFSPLRVRVLREKLRIAVAN
jgi:diacylglycerol kinase (ATP)